MANIRLALRDWDHLVPVATGEVRPDGFELTLESRAVTPDVLSESELDGGETSFSRYVLGRAAGDDRLVGLPVFVMRGFRHRCLLVRRDSGLTALEELKGARVGLTGWPDSGNTWTRALLRAAGVDLTGIEWTVGPLVAGETGKDRVGPVPFPGNVSLTDDGLTEGLAGGRYDAIMTPFMPPEFFTPDSRFRHLLPDHRAAERAYYEQTGFVPGIHLVTLKRESVERDPGLPGAVLDLFDRSKRHWLARRRLLTDTTPWLLADLTDTARTFGQDWMPYGAAQNAAMTAAFCAELHAQGISNRPIKAEEVFAA
ncbi:substrate-binding domain-containing protein [Nonomuraea solani]|uniref:hypothetical protein n=1 Tax=Nonomuraea solani TaxID=1144553 RepID=UPI000CDEDCA4|nr:hypothetical protein [Nonomuraea solani]